MKKFLDNVTSSEVLQAVLAILLWGTICYLYVADKVVPDTLLSAGSVVLGFYFHNVAQLAIFARKVK